MENFKKKDLVRILNVYQNHINEFINMGVEDIDKMYLEIAKTDNEITFDALWDNIIEYGIATKDELRLVCHINGSKIETLNDVLEVRTSYKDWEQYKSME